LKSDSNDAIFVASKHLEIILCPQTIDVISISNSKPIQFQFFLLSPFFENVGHKEGKWERSIFNVEAIDKLRSHHHNLDRDECLWRSQKIRLKKMHFHKRQ